MDYDPCQWLNERSATLVTLMRRLCKLDDKPTSNYRLSQIISINYGTQHKKLVLPGPFRHNSVVYSFLHSQQLMDYINSILLGSSYTTLTEWITAQGSNMFVFPQGDVHFCKRYLVNAKSNVVPASVISSHSNLIL